MLKSNTETISRNINPLQQENPTLQLARGRATANCVKNELSG